MNRKGTRILMTADTVGGVWHYALTLASALGEAEVVLATMGGRLSRTQRQQVRGMRVEVEESRYRLEWMQDPWADVQRAGEWLLGLEARHRPELIHLNSYAHGALPWRAPVVVVGHSCVLSWWQAVHRQRAPAAYRNYEKKIRAGLHAADLVVAPSHFMMGQLHRLYGPLRTTQVIHNGTCGGFRPAPKQEFVLTVGRLWDKAKNVHTVAAAAAGIRWPVHVVGEAHHPDGGQVDLEQVRCHGQLAPDLLVGLFAKAGIYAFPAYYEPFGLSVLEAAQSGCPLVLGDIPSFRELWDGAATFVPPDDSTALAGTINALIDRPRRRSRLAEAACGRAEAFKAEAMARAYWGAYRRLLDRPAARLAP